MVSIVRTIVLWKESQKFHVSREKERRYYCYCFVTMSMAAADLVGGDNVITDEGSKTAAKSEKSRCAKYSSNSMLQGDIGPTRNVDESGSCGTKNIIDNDNADRRLDAVWADVEREFEATRTSPPNSPPYSDENYLGDVTIGGMKQARNRTPSSSSTLPINPNYQKTESRAKNNQTRIQKYRVFLRKNQTSFDLIEHFMERFLFYGYLFKHDHTGISTEMYYAAWNIVRWMNDVVLKGWGEGIGMTVGTREDWVSSSTSCYSRERKGCMSETIFLQLHSAVPLIRTILTATTCIYPAMEAWSRRSLHVRPTHDTSLLLKNDANDQQCRQLDWELSQFRAAQVSYTLERVRFAARLALLSFSCWAQHRRKYSNKSDGNERRRMLPVPSLLKRGGELDPYEQLIPLQDAEVEAKVMQYVGRRTGRRSVPSSLSRSCASSYASNSSGIFTWLSRLTASDNKILYYYAVGELLHIIRPLYWSHAENEQWQRRFSSTTVLQKPYTATATSTSSSWKSWCISLFIDVMSDKVLQINNAGDFTDERKLLAKGAGRHSHQRPPSAEHAKLEELERRRSRLMLYLFRSPMYNTVTCPLATFIGKILSMIPSFGLARWASEYIMDMMSYWNSHRFMLES